MRVQKSSRLAPIRQIREGWSRYRLGEFNSAVRIFRSVQASQPRGSDFQLQALYGEASCWNHRRDGRDIAKAVAAYRAVIEEAPQDPLAAWCALDIVRTRHLAPADQPIDYGRTRSRLRDRLSDLSGHARRARRLFCTRTVFRFRRPIGNRPAKILENVTAFLSAHPKTPFPVAILQRHRRMLSKDGRPGSTHRVHDQGARDPGKSIRPIRSTIARPRIGTLPTPPNSRRETLPWRGNITGG